MTKKTVRRPLTRFPEVTDLAAASADAANNATAPSKSARRPAGAKPIRHLGENQAPSLAAEHYLDRYGPPPPDFWYSGDALVGYTTPSAQQPSILTLKPVAVSALLVDMETGEMVVQITFLDLTNTERTIDVPLAQLSSRSADASTNLAARGVPVMDAQLLRLLMLQAARPDLPRVAMLRRLGFSFGFDRNDPERLAFAEPGRVIAPQQHAHDEPTTPNAQVDDQPTSDVVAEASQASEPALCVDPTLTVYSDAPIARLQAYGQHGTLQEWIDIVRKAQGNEFFVFALCVAFGSIVNPLHRGEGTILHCYGASSSGKTTGLQLCGSVFGLAGDPIRSCAPTVVGGWSMTTNGMEVVARALSGLCQVLDELGALLGTLDIYSAAGGMSKTRMSRDLSAAPTFSWTLYAFSSGEKSVEQHVRDTQRRAMKAGEKVRAVDIPTGPLLDDCEHDIDERRRRADEIKAGLELVGGSAAPAFAQRLMNSHPTASSLCEMVRNQVDEAQTLLVEELEKGRRPLAPHERRTVRHFAGVLAGGWLAAETGVLPFSEEEVGNAVLAAATAWLEQDHPVDELTSVCRALRHYVLRHRGQMRDTEQDKDDPHLSYGLLHKGLLLLTHQQFEDACGTLNPHHAKQALRDAGILKHEAGKLTLRVNIQELGLKQAQFVALHYGRLFDEGEPPMATPVSPQPDEASVENDALTDEVAARHQLPANDDAVSEDGISEEAA